jgi:hypothetical protein
MICVARSLVLSISASPDISDVILKITAIKLKEQKIAQLGS